MDILLLSKRPLAYPPKAPLDHSLSDSPDFWRGGPR